MKKTALLSVFVLSTLLVDAAPVVLPRVDVDLFVNKGRTDFDLALNQNPDKKKAEVELLFENNLLKHDYSKAVDSELKFAPYWDHFSKNWFMADLDRDGQEELIFSGKPLVSNEKEQFSLFVKYGRVWKEVFWDDGYLMAYKIHPNTGEIILYHHRYPCCQQFTHLVQRVRWVRNKIRFTKRYFIARDTGIKGQLFPKKSKYPKSYVRLKKAKVLYWSKGKIKNDASIFAKTNSIIHYPKNSHYQVLARENGWSYVMMVSPPKLEESPVANPHNLQDARYYGWLKD